MIAGYPAVGRATHAYMAEIDGCYRMVGWNTNRLVSLMAEGLHAGYRGVDIHRLTSLDISQGMGSVMVRAGR